MNELDHDAFADAVLQRFLDTGECDAVLTTIQGQLSMQVLTIWGLAGVHTSKFGFKNVWEIWFGCIFFRSGIGFN